MMELPEGIGVQAVEPIEEEQDMMGMTNDIAIAILDRLTLALGDTDKQLTVLDLKDITSMFKEVGAYVQKNNSAGASTSKGLASFLSRLKA